MDRLLEWYRASHRDLPWRTTRDPYAVWVSEVMLQQTRVETVLRYFGPFRERFPSMAALADAPLDEVLRAWEGLGYYARCRNLHRGAAWIARHRDGRFPDDVEDAARVPGVGRSTAGAVVSIAYGRAEPVLDGNVRRVIARLLAEHDDPRTPAAERRLWAEATRLVRASSDPGDHNQALMELGATVCLPRRPRCGECPIRERCAALAEGTQDKVPARGGRRPLPEREWVAIVVRDGPRILLVRRPDSGLLGGLWGLPSGPVLPGESRGEAAARVATDALGPGATVGEEVASVRQAFTHFRMTLRAFLCAAPGGTPVGSPGTPVAWEDPARPRRALGRADRRLLDSLDGRW
jgi:A/G-specific adenine glycosylase